MRHLLRKPTIRLGLFVVLMLMIAALAISVWRLQRVTVLAGSLSGTWEFEDLAVDGQIVYAGVSSYFSKSTGPGLYFAKGQFGGSDGCNDFQGNMELDADGAVALTGYSSTVVGCSIVEATKAKDGEEPIGQSVLKYNNNVFIEALLSATFLEVAGDELKLYYPASKSNILVFRRRTNP